MAVRRLPSAQQRCRSGLSPARRRSGGFDRKWRGGGLVRAEEARRQGCGRKKKAPPLPFL